MLVTTLLGCALAQSPSPPVDPAGRRVVVVEALTGEPVAGAEVLCVAEIKAPVWGEEWWTHRRVTDDAGEALVPRPTKEVPYGWLFVRAEGFGGRAAGDSRDFSTWGTGEIRMELMPETPVAIELFDFTGSPLPLAHLGVTLGCGHTCDLLSAVTGPDGRATLRGFYDYDGGISDLFIVHADVGRTTYSSVPLEDMVDGIVPVYAPGNGELLRGRVLLADRSPAVGYAVGMRATHRGPWAITDAEGRFQLYGWDRVSWSLDVYDADRQSVGGFNGVRSGMERLLVLDGSERLRQRADEGDVAVPVAVPLTVEVSVPWLASIDLREHDRAVHVEAWDPLTGRAFEAETRAPENIDATILKARLYVAPGEYLVEAGRSDTPYSPVGLGLVRVDADGSKAPLRVTIPAPRLVTIEVPVHDPDATFAVYRRDFAETFKDGEDGVKRLESGALVVERFAVPHGRLGFSLERVVDGALRRIDLEVDPRTQMTDRWTLRRKRR